jgi:hypothetical protein
MLQKRSIALGLTAASFLFVAASYAATAKTYQVTGPVLDVSDTMITVQKGKDHWEIARDPSTKVTGDLKVGARVTIEYRMTATAVEVKESKSTSKKAKTK